MTKDKFLRGAMILTMAGLMVKIIGSVNRILLSRLLGGEGIGLYQLAYPVYLLLLSVSSAGIPIAISIIVAEKVAKGDFASAGRVFRVSLGLMTLTGLVFAGGLYFAAGWLVESGLIRDPRAYYGLIALTPAVFFATILASFRGYFQGYQMMTPPAVSQILEQFVRVITMVMLAYFLLPHGLEYAAAGAAFGAVPGSITGLVVLSFFYLKKKMYWQQEIGKQLPVSSETVGQIARRLLMLALPVSCATIMVPVTSSIDMLLVPNRLVASGFSIEEATTLFGYLAGMGMPLIMMATIPTLSLAASLVPAVSEAFTLGDKAAISHKSNMAMKLCCLLTFPAAAGLWTLAQPISKLLYGTELAGAAIRSLSPSICLLGISQITTGILQGLGQTVIPMWNMLLSAAVKAAAVWYLTALPFNIIGAAWASNINFALAAALNIFFLVRSGLVFKVAELCKILLAALLMAVVSNILHNYLVGYWGNTLTTITAILAAGIVYVAALIISGTIGKKELSKLPLIGSRFK